jgi:hypothetical protein
MSEFEVVKYTKDGERIGAVEGSLEVEEVK